MNALNTQQLIDELNEFPTALSIRDHLKLNNIKGYRGNAEVCPISNWVSQSTGMEVETEGTIKVFFNEDDWDEYGRSYKEFDTSEAVKEFIDSFDFGHFPELDYEASLTEND